MAGTIREAYIANALATLGNTDIVPIGEDPGGTPADGGIAYSDLLAQLKTDMFDSGTTGPTAVAITNIDSLFGEALDYIRVGNFVFVTGAITVNCTAGSTLSEFRIPPPIASNFANDEDCVGSMYQKSDAVEYGLVLANPGNNTILFRFTSTGTSNHVVLFHCQYKVI